MIILLSLSVTFMPASAYTYKLQVKNQQEFDELNVSIHHAIDLGYKRIVVNFKPGQYFFKEKHLSIGEIRNMAVSLVLKGNGAVIIPNGSLVSATGVIDGYSYNSSIINLEKNEKMRMWKL